MALLFIDAGKLVPSGLEPPAAPWRLGSAIPPDDAWVGEQHSSHFLEFDAVHDGTNWRIIDAGRSSRGELYELRDMMASRVGVTYSRSAIWSGSWAPTRITVEHRVRLAVLGGNPLGATEGLAIRRAAAAHVRGTDIADAPAIAQELTRGGSQRVYALPLGYVHNTISLLVALGLIVSLPWIPRAPEWIRNQLRGGRAWLRAQRRRHAQARGMCSRCGYSIVGLPEPRCPECGEDITRSLALRVPREPDLP